METIHLISKLWALAFLIAVYSEVRATIVAIKLKRLTKIDFGTNVFGSISILSLKAALPATTAEDVRELIEKLIASKQLFYYCVIIGLVLFSIPYVFNNLIS